MVRSGRKKDGLHVACGHLYGCGCRHWDGCCDACPLLDCVFTGKAGVQGKVIVNAPRNREIVAARAAGAPVNKIAQDFHLSESWVFRVLARARKRTPAPGERFRAA